MITLSKLEFEDISILVSLKSESWFGTHRNSFVNLRDQEAWFKSIDSTCNDPKNLFLMATREGCKIGIFKITNIDWISRIADVGWDIFKEYRHNGFGKKLVQTGVVFCRQMLNLRRLNAEILANNVPSIKCAEHAGFLLEGAKKQCVFKDGCYLDSLIYGILL